MTVSLKSKDVDEKVLNKKILNLLKLTLTVWFDVSASGAL